MRIVTLEVSSREKINRRFLRAFEGEPQGEFISFDSPELLFKVISAGPFANEHQAPLLYSSPWNPSAPASPA